MNAIVFFPSIPIAPPELCLATRRGVRCSPMGSLSVPDSCRPGPSQLVTSQVPLGILSHGFRTRMVSMWFAPALQTLGILTVFLCPFEVRPDLQGPPLPSVHILVAHILVSKLHSWLHLPFPSLHFLLSHFHLHLFILCHVFLKSDIKSFPEQTTALN